MHPRTVFSRPLRSAFWLLSALAATTLASCGRQPVAPLLRAGGTGPGAIHSSDLPAYAAARVVARLVPGTSASDLAAGYGTQMLDYVPEIELALLRTPTGVTDQAFLTRLSADPRVQFAEPDYTVETAEARQSTVAFSEGNHVWSDVADQSALARIGAPQALALARGDGVLVAMLDTGIELTHPALSGHLSLPGIEPGVTIDPGNDRAEQVDTNGDGIVDEALGHGTHVAGLVLAVAPGAELLPVRVLDSDGVGYAFAVARGLILAVDRGARVANLSLGLTQVSNALETAIEYARDRGVVVVAAAGNEDAPTLDFPASSPAVVAVAGTDALDHKASFSDYGPQVSVAAPAVGLLSTYVGGGYAVWSGTSMAAPFASGIAALVSGALGAHTADDVDQIVHVLRLGALSLATIDPTYGSALGSGRVSALASVEAVTSTQPDPATAPSDPTTQRR